ncbi:hypothetical protein ACQEV4_02680 [Streptomyces shenzhenensis]|uniref:hypothetical protein n=1 Tax=Streptomyces shenzhenensis TaxID=943815 RepID=UPI003D94ADB8
MTALSQVTYAGGPDGPAFEGWALLATLASWARRMRLGALATGNRLRPPAMPARIATTVGIVAGSRLDFGSRPGPPIRWPSASTRRAGCPATTPRTP